MQYKSHVIKIILYFAVLSFGISVAITEITSCTLFVIGALLGPILTLLLLKRKGLYSVCTFLVFLAEFSVLFACLYESTMLVDIISNVATGMSITSTMFMCPVITHFLKGPVPFMQIFPAVIAIIFGGLIAINPVLSIYNSLLDSGNFKVAVLLVLACNFLTVLSMWKHRLVLLK